MSIYGFISYYYKTEYFIYWQDCQEISGAYSKPIVAYF